MTTIVQGQVVIHHTNGYCIGFSLLLGLRHQSAKGGQRSNLAMGKVILKLMESVISSLRITGKSSSALCMRHLFFYFICGIIIFNLML